MNSCIYINRDTQHPFFLLLIENKKDELMMALDATELKKKEMKGHKIFELWVSSQKGRRDQKARWRAMEREEAMNVKRQSETNS